MAESFYKGAKRSQVQQEFKASGGPDMSQAYRNIEQEKNDSIQKSQGTVNALTSLGQNLLKVADAKINQAAKIQGIQEAQADIANPNRGKNESTASTWSWGGDTQRDAYNNLRVQTELVDFPETVEAMITNDKELGGKSLDELTNNERAAAYERAKGQYFKERGITNSGYKKEADEYAMKMEAAHLPKLHQQAQELRESKSTAMIGEQVSKVARQLKSSVDVDAFIKNMHQDYAKSLVLKGDSDETKEGVKGSLGNLASKTKTDEAIMKGLMESIMKDPKSNASALEYLKSKEAKESFGYLKGFDGDVQRVDKLTIASINQVKAAREEAATEDYYNKMRTGQFKDSNQLRTYLDGQNYMSEKQKYDYFKSGAKELESSNSAYDLKDAYVKGEAGIINSQSKEVKKALFQQEVGDPSQFRFNEGKVDLNAMRSLVAHSNKGYDVDDSIIEFFDAKTMNPKTLSNQLENLVAMKDMGMNNLTSVIPANAIPRLEMYAKMKAEGVEPKEMKVSLQKYDDFAAGIGGAEVWVTVDKLWADKDNKFDEKVASWVQDGGSGLFSSQMQPTFTTGDMSEDNSRPSNNYAQAEIKRSFARYIYAGNTGKQAMDMATNDFKNNNEWQEFGNTQVYVPKYLKKDAKSIMDFVDNENMIKIGNETPNILSEIMVSKGLSPSNKEMRDIIKNNNISVQPAADFGITRRMEVYFDGKPTGYNITKEQLDLHGSNNATAVVKKKSKEFSDELSNEEKKRIKEREAFAKLTNKVQELFK